MLKKFLRLGGIGFLAGIVICFFITIVMGDGIPATPVFIERVGSLKAALLIEMGLTGLYGAVNFGSVIIYDTDRFPLMVASLLHCSIVILPFIPLSFLLGWVTDIESCVIMLLFQLSGYFIIWIIIYINYRRETRRLNELQKHIQNIKQKPHKEESQDEK